MKVRLIGIFEERRYDIDTPKRPIAEDEPLQATETKYVRARLIHIDQFNSELSVPYEMVRGSEIGDEFTVHLERVRK